MLAWPAWQHWRGVEQRYGEVGIDLRCEVLEFIEDIPGVGYAELEMLDYVIWVDAEHASDLVDGCPALVQLVHPDDVAVL